MSALQKLPAVVLLLLATIMWGAAAPIIKFTLGGISPFPFLVYRFFLAALFSIVLFAFQPVKLPTSRTQFFLVCLYGFLATTVALSVLFIGLSVSSVLDLALIGNTSPLLIALGGWLLFRDHITQREIRGTLLALFGVIVIVVAPLMYSNESLTLTGNFFLLTFLLVDSSSVLLSKYLLKKNVDPFLLGNLAFIVGFISLTPFVMYFLGYEQIVREITQMEFKYHLGVMYMAFISGNVAHILLNVGMKKKEVSEVGLFTYLQPLFSAPLAVIWLGEQVTSSFIFGGVIIILGIYIAETKAKKKTKRVSAPPHVKHH